MTHPTQPNIYHGENLNPRPNPTHNPIKPMAICVDKFSEFKKFLIFGLLPFRTHDPTQPNPPKFKNLDPAQSNPWVDQPMDNSVITQWQSTCAD